MNNILSNLIKNFSMQNNNNQQSFYPNFNNQTMHNDNSQNNIIQKLLPMLISGKGLNDALSSLTNSNPLLSSIMSINKPKEDMKIESDKIDVSSLSKIN